MAFLTPYFDRLLELQLEDREKLRARAWQAVAACAAIIAFTINIVVANLPALPLWLVVFLAAWMARLAWLAHRLVRDCLLPSIYRPPGHDPANWLNSPDAIAQPLENIMAAHAEMVGARVRMNIEDLRELSKNLHGFAAKALRSFIFPPVLGAAALALLLRHFQIL